MDEDDSDDSVAAAPVGVLVGIDVFGAGNACSDATSDDGLGNDMADGDAHGECW